MSLLRLWLPVLAVLFSLTACTTLEPVEMPAAELQDLIVSGDVTLVGKSAKIVTADGRTRKYRVTDVDTASRLIHGHDVAVRIDDVVAIETAEFSLGKTALLAGGSYLAIALIAIAAAPAFLL